MSYSITAYTRARAKVLGVSIKRSTNKKKKIDVFKNGKKVIKGQILITQTSCFGKIF